MCLGFSKLLVALIYGKICIYVLRIHYKKRSEKDLFDNDYMLFFFSDFLYNGIHCGYPFALHGQVDAIQMNTHNICLYKKYTGCYLKTTEFLDCVLIEIYVLIRSNTVYFHREKSKILCRY